MAEKITAEMRTEFGKGAARRIRRENKIPAVVYGHGNDPMHLTLPGHSTMMALKHGGANALLELDIEGRPQLALAREIQVDPLRRVLEHIDFVAVRKGEKVTVEVALVVIGSVPADRMVLMDQQTIALEVEATHIPTSVEIDVTGLEIGESVAAKDLKLPTGAVFAGDPEDLMLSVSATPSQEALDAELAGDAGVTPVVATPEVAEEA